MNKITVQCIDVEKSFSNREETLHVLKKVNLTAYENQTIIIMGPSGSGKSTLLTIIAGLLTQDSGECIILDQSINALPEKEKTEFRGKNIGFIFQNIKLIPTLTVTQNVAIPLILQRVPRNEAFSRAQELLQTFGLGKDLNNFPNILSGGEQQRIAIARACIHKPKIILCDEPTSFLDHERGKKIMDLLKTIREQQNGTIIIVTHDPRILSYGDKIIVIEDGVVKDETSSIKASLTT